MRTFTITQIKAHFKGELYSDCPEFIGQLVHNKILVKIRMNQYTYDLSKLNRSLSLSKQNIATLSSDLLRAGSTGQQAFVQLA
jgi:hypothetical protein